MYGYAGEHVIGRDDIEELSWADGAGPLFATVRLPRVRDDMRLEPVVIYGREGLCWAGEVRRQLRDGTLECFGRHGALGDRGETLIYCDTRTSKWSQVRLDPWLTAISASVEGANIRFPFPAGSWTGYTASVDYVFPPTTALKLMFSYMRPVSSCYVQVYVQDGVSWKDVSLSENTSGAKQVTESGTALNRARIGLWFNAAYNPSADTSSALISDVKIYCVGNIDPPGIVSPYPSAVIERALLSSPYEDTAHARIDGYGDAIEPLYFEEHESASEQIAEAVRHTDGRFVWQNLVLGHSTVLPPFFGARPGVRYRIDLNDPDVTAAPAIGGRDMQTVYNRMWVRYSDPAGHPRELSRSSEVPVLGDREREGVLAATDTTSQTVAESLGDLALAEASQDRHAGEIETPYLLDAETGLDVPLEHIEWGASVSIEGLGEEVTARLAEGSLAGARMRLVLDASPYALDVALARLAKRKVVS